MDTEVGTEELARVNKSLSLMEKIEQRTARLGVIGMGYVGLPLAVEMAAGGFHVTGIDVLQGTVDMLSRGESHIPDVPAERVAKLVEAGLLEFTTDSSTIDRKSVV